MKIQISKKKFYHKFDYKITLRIEGCESLRYHSIPDSRKFLETNVFPRFYISDQSKLNVLRNKDILIELCDILTSYEIDDWQKRIERGSIDIYSKNFKIIEKIQERLCDNVTSIFKTTNDITEPYTIRVKKLPNDIYKYRVFLLPHKLKNNKEEKKRYTEWIKNQKGKIKITTAVENWFDKTDWNWDPRYVLVDEESTLLMLKLRNPELVGRVYRFVTG